MALLQLVAVGVQDRTIQQGLAVREVFDLTSRDPIGWNKQLQYVISRNGDLLTKMNLSLRVGAAPQGYRWKRCWPLFFVKKLSLSIGGQEMFTTNTDTLRMKYLIDGLQTSYDWQSVLPQAPLEMTQTPPECLFDFGDEERTRLSMAAHEVYFEPLSLSELIQMKYKIPLVSLAFHEVRLQLETGSLADCLEPIGEERPILNNDASLLQKCVFSNLYTFLDIEERRAVCQGTHETQTKYFRHASGIFEKPAQGGSPLKLYSSASNQCSAAYVWVTDESGNEIPQQVIDRIRVMFNGHSRQEHSGFESRMAVRQLLPHPTLPNTKSQNLYYISYYPGRTEINGFEQGANFGRIDHHGIELHLSEGAPQRVKVNLVHREQNTLMVMSGMAGLRYATHSLEIGNHPPQHPRTQVQQASQMTSTIQFQNTDQLIDIYVDQKACIITMEDFEEGEVVQQCRTCKKVMNSDALDRWVRERSAKTCIHCRSPYSSSTFRKGKAHLLSEPRVQEEVRDTIPLVNREHHTRQPTQEGLLKRILIFLGFATSSVHPHTQ